MLAQTYQKNIAPLFSGLKDNQERISFLKLCHSLIFQAILGSGMLDGREISTASEITPENIAAYEESRGTTQRHASVEDREREWITKINVLPPIPYSPSNLKAYVQMLLDELQTFATLIGEEAPRVIIEDDLRSIQGASKYAMDLYVNCMRRIQLFARDNPKLTTNPKPLRAEASVAKLSSSLTARETHTDPKISDRIRHAPRLFSGEAPDIVPVVWEISRESGFTGTLLYHFSQAARTLEQVIALRSVNPNFRQLLFELHLNMVRIDAETGTIINAEGVGKPHIVSVKANKSTTYVAGHVTDVSASEPNDCIVSVRKLYTWQGLINFTRNGRANIIIPDPTMPNSFIITSIDGIAIWRAIKSEQLDATGQEVYYLNHVTGGIESNFYEGGLKGEPIPVLAEKEASATGEVRYKVLISDIDSMLFCARAKHLDKAVGEALAGKPFLKAIEQITTPEEYARIIQLKYRDFLTSVHKFSLEADNVRFNDPSYIPAGNATTHEELLTIILQRFLWEDDRTAGRSPLTLFRHGPDVRSPKKPSPREGVLFVCPTGELFYAKTEEAFFSILVALTHNDYVVPVHPEWPEAYRDYLGKYGKVENLIYWDFVIAPNPFPAAPADTTPRSVGPDLHGLDLTSAASNTHLRTHTRAPDAPPPPTIMPFSGRAGAGAGPSTPPEKATVASPAETNITATVAITSLVVATQPLNTEKLRSAPPSAPAPLTSTSAVLISRPTDAGAPKGGAGAGIVDLAIRPPGKEVEVVGPPPGANRTFFSLLCCRPTPAITPVKAAAPYTVGHVAGNKIAQVAPEPSNKM